MENENNFKRTNEVYKMAALDWIRWIFDLIIYFAERWDEIPKPRSKAERDSKLSANETKREGVEQ